MSEKRPLTKEEIAEIVAGIDVDWQQTELLGKMLPGQRHLVMLQASEMLRAGLRTAFNRKFPELSASEINMKVLTYLTPVRMR